MKKLELLTLSIVTATLIVATGCSDDDGDKKASGPSAPSKVTAPAELNTSSAHNAVALIYRTGSIRPAPKKDWGGRGGDGNVSESSTDVRDCDISGTETTTRSTTRIDNGDAGWSRMDSASYTFDNCIDYDDVYGYDKRTRNGVRSETVEDAYSAETDTQTTHAYGHLNYTDFYENNTTQKSRQQTYTDLTREFKGSVTDSLERRVLYRAENGEDKYIETDVNGNVIDGKRRVYSINGTEERIADVSKEYTANGFFAHYETNSTGDESLKESDYYSNYTVHWYKPDTGDDSDNREEAVTVNGTIGSTCLGGSITITTDPVVHSNQYAYFDKDGNNPNESQKSSSVLPYSGKQTISGANSATIIYDFNSTKNTSATITIGEESMKYGTWDEFLTDSSCLDDDG